MTYNYTQPSVNVCNPFVNPALTACGNTHLGNQFVGPQFSTFEERNNYFRRPRPASVVINTGDGRVAEQLNTHALFAQDQWTFKRLTLSGALRYDRATSSYDSTCVDADVFVPADLAYCTGEHDGVSFNDLSPRWGRRLRPVRQRQNGHQVQLRQVPGTGGAQRRLRRRQPGAADGERPSR